jgi:hypothetical protein
MISNVYGSSISSGDYTKKWLSLLFLSNFLAFFTETCYSLVMFSYLSSVQSLTNASVYNRGLKIYLEGEVGRPKNLTLDSWREYRVVGSFVDEYHIHFPLIHLLVNPSNFSKAPQIIEEVVGCECQYFFEYGVCKHIVAVCASLDKEFGFERKDARGLLKKVADSDGVMESIFEAERVRNERKWIDVLQQYLTRDIPHFYELDRMAKEVADNSGQHGDFLDYVLKLRDNTVGDYLKEKKLIRIILETILVGKEFWWDFWNECFFAFDERNIELLLIGLWKIHLVGSDSGFLGKSIGFFKGLPETNKDMLICILEKEFRANSGPLVIDFCFQIGYEKWLSNNVSLLSPQDIIRLCLLAPENREDYEFLLLNQLKVWVDFLQSGNYKEIRQVFEDWRTKLGTSQQYDEAIQYLKTTHPKKKTLWKGL